MESCTETPVKPMSNFRERELGVLFLTDFEDRHCSVASREVQNAFTRISSVQLHCLTPHEVETDDCSRTQLIRYADLAVVDLTAVNQCNSLFTKLKLRESYGNQQTIFLQNVDNSYQVHTTLLPPHCKFMYRVTEGIPCVIGHSCQGSDVNGNAVEHQQTLGNQIKLMVELLEVEAMSCREEFLKDLQNVQKACCGERLLKGLHDLRLRLDNPLVLCEETVHLLLIAFREIQEHSAMVNLVDNSKCFPQWKSISSSQINQLYAFALIRRNEEGDREVAEKFLVSCLREGEDKQPVMLCLLGRIYKDRFVESDCKDMESLDKSVHWYRRSFETQSNVYSGINLATMLMLKGNKFETSPELQNVAAVLSGLMEQKGKLQALQDYWDVATIFELCVLLKDYSKAAKAADCMFRLQPSKWCVKSTMTNIFLINSLLKQDTEKLPDKHVFDFWVEYFLGYSSSTEEKSSRYPVLIQKSPDAYSPSYVTINTEDKSVDVSILHEGNPKELCTTFCYKENSITSVSVHKSNYSHLSLCVSAAPQSFQLIFPSVQLCKMFYQHLKDVCTKSDHVMVDFPSDIKPQVIEVL